MPNWCEGNIRFRGKIDDILKLLRERFIFCKYNEGLETITQPGKVVVDEDRYEIKLYCPFDEADKSWCYIDGTHRNFINNFNNPEVVCSAEIVYESGVVEEDKRAIVVFNYFQSAWNIEPDPYVEMSKEYGVDIQIFGWERGNGFDQHIIIEDGELILNKKRGCDRYFDWVWETEMPYMGG